MIIDACAFDLLFVTIQVSTASRMTLNRCLVSDLAFSGVYAGSSSALASS